MQAQINLLISSGQTSEALAELAKYSADALLLQAQYNSGLKNYNLGLIDFGEWGRTQARVNLSALEIAKKLSGPITVIQNVNYVYVNFLNDNRQPGTELGTTNKIFRAVERMIEDDDFPLSDLEKATETLNEIIGLSELPELMAAFDLFKTTTYLNNTDAFKVKQRRAFAELLHKYKSDIIDAVREITEMKNAETSWKEAWQLFISEPTFDRWQNTFPLIDNRVTSAVFTDEIREMWGELVADANQIPKGMTWKFKFTTKILPDLKKFVNTVLLK